jgi:uncharacterized protein DUF4185
MSSQPRRGCLFACLLAIICFTSLAFGADGEPAPPPLPHVVSVTDMGTVTQNPVIYGRDGAISALIGGKSVWTFGDTPMSVAGLEDHFWDDNSLAWTDNLDASHGITLDHDYLDITGAPGEFLPYLDWEHNYNYAHDKNHCTEEPCGAEFAMWPGQPVPDPARNRVLIFYYELWRIPGKAGWTTVGSGIAVADSNGKVTRPIENPGSRTPTLMWGPDEVAYGSGAIVVKDTLYSYGCIPGFLVMNCRLARVSLSGAIDKTQWTYYAGNNTWSANPNDAKRVFQGGDAGNTVYYNTYLGVYMAIYSGVFSNDIYFRVARAPWGPWSPQVLMFTGKDGWNNTANYAGEAHTEFAEGNGQTQYITYAHATGALTMDLPLTKVVFGK